MAQYKIGTVTVTNGSATITGSGTTWLGSISTGNYIVIAGDSVAYQVASVASNTSLTLTAPYGGTTGSGRAYVAHIDFHPNGAPEFEDGDTETAAILNRWLGTEWPASSFGTAATRDVMTSLTDSTLGRLMPVGAFGLGGVCNSSVLQSYNLGITGASNSFVKIAEISGFDQFTGDALTFLVSSGGSVGSAGRDNYLLECSQRASDVMNVRAYRLTSSLSPISTRSFYYRKIDSFKFEIWIRRVAYDSPLSVTRISRSTNSSTIAGVLEQTTTQPDNLVGASVFEYYHTGNILGAVSQSGGVPTGAVIQRGSNANGEFVRFADGTQICTIEDQTNTSMTNAFSGGFRSSTITRSFPISFSSIDSVGISSQLNIVGAFGAIENLAARDNSTIRFSYTSITSQPDTDCFCSIIAIGRWY